MNRTHRVGTLTLGLSLIVFGGLFLAHLFVPAVNYRLIWNLWPLILIFLGVEVLLSHLLGKGETIRYDVGGIVLTALLTLFAMGMGAVQYAMTYLPQIHTYWNGTFHS